MKKNGQEITPKEIQTILESIEGLQMQPIHYRGAAPAFTDVMAGHITGMLISAGTALPAAHTAAVLSVAGKLPTSSLTSSDTSVTGHLPYLVALILDSPSFQLR